MIIGVLSAMAKEHKQLTSLLTDARQEHDGNYEFVIGSLGQNTLILMQCGMGKVNAAVGTTVLIRRYHPDCVISTGCAGGIDASLKVMDVVVSTATVYHDVSIPGYEHGQMQGLPARFRSEQELVDVAKMAHPGLICTGDQFICSSEQKQAIIQGFGGLCCEMEGGAIAQVCCQNKTPFVIIRAISDKADGSAEMNFTEFEHAAAIRCAAITSYMVSH